MGSEDIVGRGGQFGWLGVLVVWGWWVREKGLGGGEGGEV